MDSRASGSHLCVAELLLCPTGAVLTYTHTYMHTHTPGLGSQVVSVQSVCLEITHPPPRLIQRGAMNPMNEWLCVRLSVQQHSSIIYTYTYSVYNPMAGVVCEGKRMQPSDFTLTIKTYTDAVSS